MLLIPCPYCGERPEIEFSYAGEGGLDRQGDLTDFLYNRTNERGPHAERWRHTHGCARFFNAIRNTETDAFISTTKPGA